ncbi:MAG: arsenate reductase ArsC [Candidatus Dadabacteria bacterium]|nr:arsenate reductase ArsC [Candidatus Dadabacteria bacterium]NIS07611.1 arsenate reductase ArsC [Candidatus Dadabacteria bacterium]NIV42065.1 arsenate reductase ArsC [Candidatus Dadabacteria bacterium]NIX16470.1 arsenate reductase ArsC [Candidatus Dadabacteria bacterium]NIY21249.1 arsenate reductase ArsC [Candidatus Dadabacteria bacterium]
MGRKKVLFVCTHNSARSQMAEGILNSFHSQKFEAFSTGSNPTSINPKSVSVSKEIGVDLSNHYSKGFDELGDIEFDYIVTVCDDAREKCPYFKGDGIRIHKSFSDPSSYDVSDEQKIMFFRKVRDEIRDWIDNEFAINA